MTKFRRYYRNKLKKAVIYRAACERAFMENWIALATWQHEYNKKNFPDRIAEPDDTVWILGEEIDEV